MGKSPQEVVAAISEMEKEFPFPIKAIDSDCETEFIYETMINTFKRQLSKVSHAG